MIYLLIVIFVLVALLYLINVRESFSNCHDNIDKDVLNSLNSVNMGLKPLNIQSINLPCDL